MAAWGTHFFRRLMTHVETDDAYVTGHIHQVHSHISGTVLEILAKENAEIKEGQILFQLDPRDSEAKVRQSEAQLAQSEAMIGFSKAEERSAQAKVDQAQAQLTKAQLDFDRAKELSRTNVASKQELDTAKAAFDSATASLTSAQAAQQAMASGMRLTEAQTANSRTALENSRLQLSYNTIPAPASGRTSKRSAEVGTFIQPGQTLIAIVEPELWIEANFKETQLATVRTGQSAEITIDAIPGQIFSGIIESIAPATGAQFAMLPPDNATGNFTKVVQRVPVRIRFDLKSIQGYEDRLRAGLSAVVAVRIK